MGVMQQTKKGGVKLTREQKAEIKECARHPIVFDEDCPNSSPKALAEFAAKARALRLKKQISLKISPDTLEKYKALGKGYTSIMGDVLSYAINNPELIAKAL